MAKRAEATGPSLGVSPRRQATRDRLVQAAIKVVARDGFHAASVNAIAQSAGFSIGALYANFKGKDELFFAVFEEHVRWFEREVAKAADAAELSAAIEEAATSMARDRSQFLIFVEFWAYAVRKPSLRRKFGARMADMRDVLAGALEERAQRENVSYEIPPQTLALVGLALGRGLTLEQFADPAAVSDQTIGELWTRLLSSGERQEPGGGVSPGCR
jgi:AcrR family transcriptional regulator